MSKDILSKAIVDVSKERPSDFTRKIEEVAAAKLAVKLNSLVKQEEQKLFKK